MSAMVSYADLRTEAAFREETIPLGLKVLRQDVLTALGWPDNRIGIVGDNQHLWGYHRSRRWIVSSRFCTNRTASVSESEGNRSGGSENDVAAMDLLSDEADTRARYERLRNAKLAGRLPQLRQVILESGPWHVHLSFDRGRLNDDHGLLFRLITEGETDMAFEAGDRNVDWATSNRALALLSNTDAVFQHGFETTPHTEVNNLKVQLDRIEGKLDRLLSGPVEAFEGAEFIVTGKITHVTPK